MKRVDVFPAMASGLLVTVLGCAMSAHAAPPKEGTPPAAAKPSGRVMSKNELRACMAQQSRLQAQSAEATKAQEELAAERKVIEGEGAALKEEVATVDRTKEEAVAAYVAKAQAHDKKIDAYQARVSQFNAQVDTVQTDKAAYSKACENRRYLEDDLSDIKAGK